jgi:hypothetical protein
MLFGKSPEGFLIVFKIAAVMRQLAVDTRA